MSDKEKTENEPFSWKAEIISWIQIIVAAVAIAFVLNNFVIANSRVPTGSMIPTIMAKTRVIGSRLSYINSDPERGDVVIFHFPDDPTGKTYYVKRIIGLPGRRWTSSTARFTSTVRTPRWMNLIWRNPWKVPGVPTRCRRAAIS